MPNPTRVLWLDLETTDTNPYAAHFAILEVGAILTDWSPDLVEHGRADVLIRPPGTSSDHELIWTRMLPVVQQMHQASGLWADATTSEHAWNLVDADRSMAAWLDERRDGELVPLAGSGVGHLDLPAIKVHMPHVAQRLTYWPLDIGNVRRMLDLAGRSDLVDLVNDVEKKPHRGYGDVVMHVEEARRYLRLLGELPAGEAVETIVDPPLEPTDDQA